MSSATLLQMMSVAYRASGVTPIVPVQHPVPNEGSNSALTYSTSATDGTVNTGGFASIPTVGNCVILEIHYEDASNSIATVTYTVADGDGNAFTHLVGTQNGGQGWDRVDYWYRAVTATGTNAARIVRVTKPQASFVEMHIQQYEFTGTYSVRTSATAQSSAATSISCGPTAAATAGDLVLACCNFNGSGSTYAITTPSGYTNQYTENNIAALMATNSAYKTSAGGTESATWTGAVDGANTPDEGGAVILVLH